jgi:hypothetical protein
VELLTVVLSRIAQTRNGEVEVEEAVRPVDTPLGFERRQARRLEPDQRQDALAGRLEPRITERNQHP